MHACSFVYSFNSRHLLVIAIVILVRAAQIQRFIINFFFERRKMNATNRNHTICVKFCVCVCVTMITLTFAKIASNLILETAAPNGDLFEY